MATLGAGKMAGGAGINSNDYELFLLVACSVLITFAMGWVDAVTYVSPLTATLSTHLSGSTAKGSIYIAEAIYGADTSHYLDDKVAPSYLTVGSFFVGCVMVGALTSRPEWRTFLRAGAITFTVSLLLFLSGILMLADVKEASAIASFAAGLMNSATTTLTGFIRATHVTGTWTDVGLLGGQLIGNEEKREDTAHWWKTKVLTSLILVFSAGTFVGTFAFRGLGAACLFFPASIILLVGTGALIYARTIDALDEEDDVEEAIETQGPKAAHKLRRAIRLNKALAEIAASFPSATADYIPTPRFSSVVSLHRNVSKAASAFLKGRTKEGEEEWVDVNGLVNELCIYLAERSESETFQNMPGNIARFVVAMANIDETAVPK